MHAPIDAVLPRTPADPLGEALHFLRMSGVLYSRCEFSAPWALELPALKDMLIFHVVTSGQCLLEVEGNETLVLRSGDYALVPHGEGHRLASATGVPGRRLFDLPRDEVGDRYEVLRLDGGGELTLMICGAVRLDHPAAQRLVGQLPRTIVLPVSDSSQMDWMQSTLRLMAEEAQTLRPGGETVITRLADILVIQAIRAWLARDPVAQSGWLNALRDRQIGRAIALIHRDPARIWTLSSLASEVAMSRSALAARFKELVGESVMQYLTRWRMQIAMTRLREDEISIGELASRLGYQSEAAFSRAFKRYVGVPPGSIRREPGAVAEQDVKVMRR